ncbi:hypothetical protein AADZ90_009615 [Aestuariibius sp. 2305UL40-4]|uniref:hypothetical protein n=1 Tax=Aestuariibius violaceus TaxID=3234132 RepID=UPI00345ED1B5
MRSLVILFAAGLTACTSVVPSTISQLRQLSPIEADPAGFVVFMDLPDGIGIIEDSAILQLGGVRDEQDESVEGTFVLERGQAGEAETFRIAEGDLERFRDLQSQIRTWKAEDEDGTTGSLSIGVGGCLIDEGPAPRARLAVSMTLEEDGPVLPLIRPTPVRRALDVLEVEDLPPC